MLFAFMVCVGLFGGIEATMRLVGYEPIPDLREVHKNFASGEGPFYPSRGDDGRLVYRRNMPDAMLSMYPHTFFPAEKLPAMFRVFCIGDSVVRGMPFRPKAAFPAWLENALKASRPSTACEVINCGTPALDSYGVMAVARLALRDWQPDLLVIYTGHNEFLVPNRLRVRRLIDRSLSAKLRRLLHRSRLYLALKASLPRKASSEGEANREADRVRGLKDEPHFTIPERNAILSGYQEHLETIIRHARQKGVKVLLCKLVANVRDYPPNVSYCAPGISAADKARIQELLAAGEELEESGQHEKAAAQYQAALDVDANVSRAHFRLGRTLEALGRYDKARWHLSKAVDLDGAPNRAISEMNRVVDDVCDGDAAIAVDIPAAFAQESPNGLVGYNLMVDHCHPSIRGHQIFAEEVYKVMAESKVRVSTGKRFRFGAEDIAWAHEEAGLSLLGLSTVGDTAARLARARSELEQALKGSSDKPATLVHLALVSLAEGRETEAAERLTAAVALNPRVLEGFPKSDELLAKAGLRMSGGAVVHTEKTE